MRVHNRDHRDQARPKRDQVAPLTTATTATTPYGGERVAGSGCGAREGPTATNWRCIAVFTFEIDPRRPRMRSSYPHAVGDQVYRLYDETGALLYVGVTYSVGQRLSDHRRRRPWFMSVRSVFCEVFPDRSTAEARERYLIAMLQPPHNVVGVGR